MGYFPIRGNTTATAELGIPPKERDGSEHTNLRQRSNQELSCLRTLAMIESMRISVKNPPIGRDYILSAQPRILGEVADSEVS